MNNKEIIEAERKRLIDEGIIFWDDELNSKRRWEQMGYTVNDKVMPVTTIKLWVKVKGSSILIKRPVNLYATYQVIQVQSAP